MPIYNLKLMFEWGGGCLWCNDRATRNVYGVGPIENKLALSNTLLKQLEQMQVWHDTALDWDAPAGPSPWSLEAFERFDTAALDIKTAIGTALGADYHIEYIQLGHPKSHKA